MSDEMKAMMYRILSSLAKRYLNIGYCQGFNFICFYLLNMKFTEEQTFWIMSYIIVNLFPKNYYTKLLPVLADIKLLKHILNEKNKTFTEHLCKIDLDLNFLVISWFLLIFCKINNLLVS